MGKKKTTYSFCAEDLLFDVHNNIGTLVTRIPQICHIPNSQ